MFRSLSLLILVVFSGACASSYTIQTVPGTKDTGRFVSAVPRRGILDTRDFVTVIVTAQVDSVEVLANGRTFMWLKPGEIARFPLPTPLFRNQTLETSMVARAYHRGQLVGISTTSYSTYGGNAGYGGREYRWDISYFYSPGGSIRSGGSIN